MSVVNVGSSIHTVLAFLGHSVWCPDHLQSWTVHPRHQGKPALCALKLLSMPHHVTPLLPLKRHTYSFHSAGQYSLQGRHIYKIHLHPGHTCHHANKGMMNRLRRKRHSLVSWCSDSVSPRPQSSHKSFTWFLPTILFFALNLCSYYLTMPKGGT